MRSRLFRIAHPDIPAQRPSLFVAPAFYGAILLSLLLWAGIIRLFL